MKGQVVEVECCSGPKAMVLLGTLAEVYPEEDWGGAAGVWLAQDVRDPRIRVPVFYSQDHGYWVS